MMTTGAARVRYPIMDPRLRGGDGKMVRAISVDGVAADGRQ